MDKDNSPQNSFLDRPYVDLALSVGFTAYLMIRSLTKYTISSLRREDSSERIRRQALDRLID